MGECCDHTRPRWDAAAVTNPILCLDFDGVLHSYTSGWVTAAFIPDPPVPGALDFLHDAIDHFRVVIFSSRSHQEGGRKAMWTWLGYWAKKEWEQLPRGAERANKIINYFANDATWPTEKPAAFLTIDDRAICFDGDWSKVSPEGLLNFRPWNKR